MHSKRIYLLPKNVKKCPLLPHSSVVVLVFNAKILIINADNDIKKY